MIEILPGVAHLVGFRCLPQHFDTRAFVVLLMAPNYLVAFFRILVGSNAVGRALVFASTLAKVFATPGHAHHAQQ